MYCLQQCRCLKSELNCETKTRNRIENRANEKLYYRSSFEMAEVSACNAKQRSASQFQFSSRSSHTSSFQISNIQNLKSSNAFKTKTLRMLQVVQFTQNNCNIALCLGALVCQYLSVHHTEINLKVGGAGGLSLSVSVVSQTAHHPGSRTLFL